MNKFYIFINPSTSRLALSRQVLAYWTNTKKKVKKKLKAHYHRGLHVWHAGPCYNGLNCDKFQFCIIKGKHELYISGLLSK